MEQRKIAVLQGRSKPGRVKLPKRLASMASMSFYALLCFYGFYAFMALCLKLYVAILDVLFFRPTRAAFWPPAFRGEYDSQETTWRDRPLLIAARRLRIRV